MGKAAIEEGTESGRNLVPRPEWHLCKEPPALPLFLKEAHEDSFR
jgi:hypothetical protein